MIISWIRAWFRERSALEAASIGLVLSFALNRLLADLAQSFAIPIVRYSFRVDRGPRDLFPLIHGARLNVGLALVQVLAFLGATAIVYALFLRRAGSQRQLGGDFDACPFCMNEVVKGARRCASCTSVIEGAT
jgi:hypothetical protein